MADTTSTINETEGQPSLAPVQPASPTGTIHAEVSSTSTDNNDGVESTTPTPSNAPTRTVQQSLQSSINRNNFSEEVGQVMGTLNSWWGGVKKQSASALTTLKADLDKTVSHAQADLEYLRTANIEVVRKDPAEYEAEQEAEKVKKAAARALQEEELKKKEKGKGKGKQVETIDTSGDNTSTSTTTGTGTGTATATNILNKLSSSTSQLQHSLQNTLQSTLAAASSNPALSNPTALRQQLAENLRLSSAKENLQLSMKQAEKLAEEYLKKSDQLLKDAEKWVEDAVKVIPPDGSDHQDRHMVSMGWDGSDFYSFSTSSPTTNQSSTISQSNNDVLFDSDGGKSKPISTLALAGSRKDALLRRLREDKDLLMVDPEGEGETEERKQEFKQWIEVHFESQKKELREKEEGNVGSIRMALVPEQLTDDQFWQRYLFHKYMIEAEERKRKALLQATTQEEETDDFNWDDEPESPSAPVIPVPIAAETTTSEVTPKVENDGRLPSTIPKSVTSASTSPRDSEESYDVVSDQGVKKPISLTSTTTNAAAPPAVPTSKDDDDEDSDWE
ncbi:uncharacterized protein IL334_000406 [Kwoniella shivajii]|uniref:BSD domain-containing protein n=1 Tax=Kwoniella shivajii TaxID=564305 RepID=A0ABZ1CS44_9TREE|nr:hypothetical protein IL334_000406 [Kwoniella shivajii]